METGTEDSGEAGIGGWVEEILRGLAIGSPKLFPMDLVYSQSQWRLVKGVQLTPLRALSPYWLIAAV